MGVLQRRESENYYYLLMYIAPSESLKVFYGITNCLRPSLRTDCFFLLVHSLSRRGECRKYESNTTPQPRGSFLQGGDSLIYEKIKK